ncbi:MAG: ABC transporter ATP-binding protein [Acidimicrobiales bacterium]|nr:ABC transporter ATP-binding protein [Acidimicrobiales bacterium]
MNTTVPDGVGEEGSLRVRAVHAGYGSVRAVRGVSLDIQPGEIVAVLGPNGAGKSTLLKVISGEIRMTSGDVRFSGTSLKGRRPDEILRLGVSHVLEGRQVFARMTVRENLELGGFSRRDRGWTDDIELMCTEFPILGQRARQLAGTLSGGEQQMLAVARGLMARPRLLLLDEPSLGLSPLLVDAVAGIVQRLKTDFGTSCLLVEQNTTVALDVASRFYVLANGEICHQASTKSPDAMSILRDSYLGYVNR